MKRLSELLQQSRRPWFLGRKSDQRDADEESKPAKPWFSNRQLSTGFGTMQRRLLDPRRQDFRSLDRRHRSVEYMTTMLYFVAGKFTLACYRPTESSEEPIRFLKVDDSWYADLPQYIEQGGSFAWCLMVAGAPELIEVMAGNDAKRATFEVSTEWFSGFEAVLNKEGEADVPDEEGSWAKYLTKVYDRTKSVHDTLHSVSLYVGLCPVNKWVFGGHHPNSIYLKFLNAE